MIATYYGENCFRLQSGEVSLLVDPISNRLKADVVLRTKTPAGMLSGARGVISQGEITFPGEYEIKGIEIRGFPGDGGEDLKAVYVVTWENIHCGFLGEISRLPAPDAMENLELVDILFLPVSGKKEFTPEVAAKLIRQLEPAVVIPSFEDSPKEFLKVVGQKVEPQEKFVFKKKDLVDHKAKVVVLEANR